MIPSKLKIKSKTKSLVTPGMTDSDKFYAIISSMLVEFMKVYSTNCKELGSELSQEWYGDFNPQKQGLYWYDEVR